MLEMVMVDGKDKRWFDMENVLLIFKGVLAVVGGFIAKMLGGFDQLVVALMTLIVIDYITGVAKAIYTSDFKGKNFWQGLKDSKLSSEIGLKGILKKVMILVAIAGVVTVEPVIDVDFPVRETIIMLFITNEGISFADNLASFFPFANKIKELFTSLKGGK